MAEAAAAMAAAYAPDIEPPAMWTLTDEERPVWVRMMRSRARREWTDLDLHHAANLVRCLADVARISAEIKVEGDVIENQRGTQIPNPKHMILSTLSQRTERLTRLLHLHASSMEVHPEKHMPERRAEQEARDAREDSMIPPGADGAELDSLLAKPGAYQ